MLPPVGEQKLGSTENAAELLAVTLFVMTHEDISILGYDAV